MSAPASASGSQQNASCSEHRGRVIAWALKLAAIAHARSRGYRALATGQHAGNAAMLRVNDRIGYRRVAENVRYERNLG